MVWQIVSGGRERPSPEPSPCPSPSHRPGEGDFAEAVVLVGGVYRSDRTDPSDRSDGRLLLAPPLQRRSPLPVREGGRGRERGRGEGSDGGPPSGLRAPRSRPPQPPHPHPEQQRREHGEP